MRGANVFRTSEMTEVSEVGRLSSCVSVCQSGRALVRWRVYFDGVGFVFVLFCVLVLRWYCIGLWHRVDVRAMRHVCMYEGRTYLPCRLDKLSIFFR